MELDNFKRYVGFDQADEELLRALWPSVVPDVDAICEEFYRRVLAERTTAAILEDPSVVGRLMDSLAVWIHELMNGPWDEAYVARRRRIGRVHVRVGVPHDAMFTAMCVVRNQLMMIAQRESGAAACTTTAAIQRVCDLDLALMTSTYHDTRHEQAVRSVQELMVTHMPALAMLVDREHLLTAATPSVMSRFGVETAVGRPLSDVLPDVLLDGGDIPAQLDHAFAAGRGISMPRVDVEFDGQPCHFAVTIVPLKQNVEVALVYLEDHTVTIENEALLRRQESLAQLGAMSATIAHELRNPLAGISGALQVIGAGMRDDERYGVVIGKVLEQIKSLNRLVSDLLAFARPRDADMKPGVDLAEVASAVAEVARDEHPHLDVRVQGAGTVTADRDMVRQALMNLTLNACQALGDDGRVDLRVSGRTVTVNDNGPGLHPDALAHLFEPFFTTKLRGTGLGLAISHRLARMMSARLTYDEHSELGGASFSLRFL